jgi:lipopolysaccharide transport system permease protein
MVAFSIFMGRMMPPDAPGDVPYPLYVYAGLAPWFFFAGAIGACSSSVVGSQALLTKVYFPRLLLPLGAIGEALVDFTIAFGMLLVLMAFFHVGLSWSVLLVPLVILTLALTALGIGTLLSALAVVYRDVMHVVPFMIQLWMFMTPTIYLRGGTIAAGPEERLWLSLNPVYGLIYNFRQVMLGGELDWAALGISAAIGLTLLVVGCLYFRRIERIFPDII